MLSYAGVALAMKKSAGAPADLKSLLTDAVITKFTELVRKCAGGEAGNPTAARAWVQEHADAYFEGETPEPPKGFVKACRESGIKGKNQKRAWMLYLAEVFREPDNASHVLANLNFPGSQLGEDASAVPPEPAPTDSVTSPKPAANMGGDPPKPLQPDAKDEGKTEGFDGNDVLSEVDADRIADEEARRMQDELDAAPVADGSSSSSSSSSSVHPYHPPTTKTKTK